MKLPMNELIAVLECKECREECRDISLIYLSLPLLTLNVFSNKKIPLGSNQRPGLFVGVISNLLITFSNPDLYRLSFI